MNVVLFGASGMIGSCIARELLSRGHTVTAVVRDPSKLEPRENLIITAGDILDPASVSEIARDADAVISAYGPGPDKPDILVKGIRTLIEGVRNSGVRRLVVVGGAGTLEAAPGVQLLDMPDFPAEWKAIAIAHGAALEELRGSDLEWTSAAPAAYIHPGERTGRFRLGTDRLIVNDKGQSEISCEDFAIAVVDEIEQPQHVQQRFTAAW